MGYSRDNLLIDIEFLKAYDMSEEKAKSFILYLLRARFKDKRFKK